LESVDVEALPSEMPEAIEVSLETLTELEQTLTVGDIVAPAGATILTPGEFQIAQVARPRLEVEEAEAVPEGEEGVELPEREAAAGGEAGGAEEESSGDE
jgi:hypothetical protein